MSYGGYYFEVKIYYDKNSHSTEYVVANNIREAIYLATRDLTDEDYIRVIAKMR